MLVFCRANKVFLQEVNDLLQDLAYNTGLSINRTKNRKFFSKGCKKKKELSAVFGISEGALPVRYLGLPLTIQYPKAIHFLPLIDKLRARWKDGWRILCPLQGDWS